MEDKIKNFDRSIEQAMNETSVTPPFGMWNRISAELEAPAPAPTSWTASSLIPKAALMGLVTVAVLETSLLVAYVFNNSPNKITTENITASQEPMQSRNIIAIPEVSQEQIAALPERETKVTLSRKIKMAPAAIAKPVDKNAIGVNQSQPALTNIAANSEVAVPQQQVKQDNGIGVATEAYYFPPVDINKPEPKVAEKDAAPTAVKTDDDAIEPDKKVTLPAEQKIKFKPRKHHHQHLGFFRPASK